MAPTRVAVVVPTYNRARRVGRLIAALEDQTRRPDEVVLVDDCSPDGTAEEARRCAAASSLSITVVALEQNSGPAVARNVGWKATTADVIAFTDDDCDPEPGWLEHGVAAMDADERVGVVQGRTLPAVDERRSWEATREVLKPSPFFEGCNLLFRRAALDATDGFSEHLRMGGEDTWLGWSVLSAGWDRAFAFGAVVRHDVTFPGLRWHLRQAWLEGNLVPVARQFPEFRAHFWCRWAFRGSHVAMYAALVGALLARRWWPAILLAAPYAWTHRTRRPSLTWLDFRWRMALIDVTQALAMLRNSLRYRTLVL